ncbi:MAG: pyrroloquinoline quinone-dependent dehydrogenase [Gemmatimonadota bacterium]
MAERRIHRIAILCAIGVANAASGAIHHAVAAQTGTTDWTSYGNDPGGTRYSSADQITRENVDQLEVAWTYRTGDYGLGEDAAKFEATPLLVDGTLYVSTPFGRVIALDPETGAERWSFDGNVDLSGDYGDFANRGVSTWDDPERGAGDRCLRRIFLATIDARLFAMDGESGAPCEDFGDAGMVDLNEGLRHPPAYKGEYQVTSPPAVVGDHVVVGSAIADNVRVHAPSGVVRAFDARTGEIRWAWDPIPLDPADPAHATWGGRANETGAANAWSVLSVDPGRDLVFVPTGSPSPDFYGGRRPGENRYANSVVALRGATGEVVWHFQAVHHDLWDYDVPAQPVLTTILRDGREIPVVLQTTKMGHLFVLHRETGEPVFPVEERPVPASTVPGEEAWPTQPFPELPPPLVPTALGPDDAWGVSEADRSACHGWLAGLRSEGIFTPPSLEGTVVFPGNVGGSNWSGLSVDPVRGLAIVPTNRLATIITLIPRDQVEERRAELVERYREVTAGPGFELTEQTGAPYAMAREWALSPSMLPCNPPPWGALTAVDLASGVTRWEVPLGSMAGDAPEVARWGSVGLGGALVTGGGLVFIAGTFDHRLRAFDVEAGEELWSVPLPAGGNATPMTYRIGEEGRQYVVLAAGGHEVMGGLGDYVLAFALPGPGGAPRAPAPGSLSGEYHGRLVVGQRIPATLTLQESPGGAVTGTLAGTLESEGGTIRGGLSGTRSEDALTFEIGFEISEPECTGTVSGTAVIANAGSLLVGEVLLTGACSESEETGTLAVWRQGP